MPYKNKRTQQQYQREWAKQERADYNSKTNQRKRQLQQWFLELKQGYKCVVCSEDYPPCLDFHHENSDDKDVGVGHMASKGFSKARILKEIEKCVCVCANCHRKIHYDRHSKLRKQPLGIYELDNLIKKSS